MAKRAKVPTALHTELTEYASLLRALRTSNTLDLSTQLVEPSLPSSSQSFAGNSSIGDEDVDFDASSPNEPPPTESVSAGASSEPSSPSRLLSGLDRDRVTGKRDLWTRWPLLAGDVHVPEWGLVDEVKHIVEQFLTSESQGTDLTQEDDVEDLSLGQAPTPATPMSPLANADEHPALSALGLQTVTAHSSAFLARILALLAAHVPAAEKSMQNRIRPISWETVLDIACSGGAISPRTAEAVYRRMSRLYIPSQPNVLQRLERSNGARHTLTQTLSELNDSLLALPPQMKEKPKAKVKRKRGPYKKRNKTAQTDSSPSPKRQRVEEG